MHRYAHPALPGTSPEGQVRRSADARERIAAVRDGRAVPVATADGIVTPDASGPQCGQARP